MDKVKRGYEKPSVKHTHLGLSGHDQTLKQQLLNILPMCQDRMRGY